MSSLEKLLHLWIGRSFFLYSLTVELVIDSIAIDYSIDVCCLTLQKLRIRQKRLDQSLSMRRKEGYACLLAVTFRLETSLSKHFDQILRLFYLIPVLSWFISAERLPALK